MTRTATTAKVASTTATPATEATLRDLAYVLQLTRRVSADIRTQKLVADRATPAKLAAV